MNDVKMNSADLASRQNSAASSQRSQAPVQQESTVDVSRSSAQERKQLKLASQEQSQAQIEQTKEAVKDAVTRLNDYVQSVQRDLQFQLDDNSGKTVVTVIDSRTNEVVRQIPDDVALRLARDLQQDEPLSLFNAKV